MLKFNIHRNFWLLSVLLLIACCGCVESTISIKLNKDGSGYITVSRANYKGVNIGRFGNHRWQRRYSYRRSHYMNYDRMQLNRSAVIDKKFFNTTREFDYKMTLIESELLGNNVHLKKMKTFATSNLKGYVAVYKFDNINDLKIHINHNLFFGIRRRMENLHIDLPTITFSYQPVSRDLKINIPDFSKPIKMDDGETFDKASLPEFFAEESLMSNMGIYDDTQDSVKEKYFAEVLKTLKFSLELDNGGKKPVVILDVDYGEIEAKGKHGIIDYAIPAVFLHKHHQHKAVKIVQSKKLKGSGE